ncbi:unnamed protein product [Sphagnum jensenii]|uniref:Putative exodeoxyribonuclease 8 PDDEXK-like domain-containing protein n=1 Tax=Sphagnum jensenii TaxID=128206 RepID=A0ABP0V8D1_9BRYO
MSKKMAALYNEMVNIEFYLKDGGLPQTVQKDFKPHWIENLESEKYHADRGSLSSTGLKVLLAQTPAHFKSNWTRGEDVGKEKDHLRYGSLAHLALLEPEKFRSSFVLEPVFEGFTKDGKLSTQSKEAKDKKKLWYANLPQGSLVVTPEDYSRIEGGIKSILAHKKAVGILNGAKTEISGFFRHPATGIKCRIRPDILHIEKMSLTDFKTTRCAAEWFFGPELIRRKYHISLMFYALGVKEITGKMPDKISILAVEKDPPYACALWVMSEETMKLGLDRVEEGMAIMKSCLDTNTWPSYQENGLAQEIQVPQWAFTEQAPFYNFEHEELSNG